MDSAPIDEDHNASDKKYIAIVASLWFYRHWIELELFTLSSSDK